LLDDPELLLLREDPPEDLALGAGLELCDLSGARAAGAGALPLERSELGTVALGLGADLGLSRERLGFEYDPLGACSLELRSRV
jgi:hypothetical protein